MSRNNSQHPLERILWVDPNLILPNEWNPNRVAPPEMRLLERSLLLTGWVQPLLVAPSDPPGDYRLIDGFHRWTIARSSERVRETLGPLVPVSVLDLDLPAMMLLTVRINRAKGEHGSVAMGRLVQALVAADVPVDRICEEMGATPAEVDLLAQPDAFKARRGDDGYSPAWHPVEDGRKASDVARERARG